MTAAPAAGGAGEIDVWIPLADGTRLSAKVWLPAGGGPAPAILEYLPYRKSDSTAIDDSLRHPTFAAHGYAAVRVDIRGSGDSEGVLLDEYHEQERDDAEEVIAWIARQPWCSGSVGMMGISWGGFNSLQIAARRPPALKAIITACSTDDRYADDVHYMGGSVLAYYLLPWATTLLAFNARPPLPSVVGERWRELWLERLEANPFLAETWLQHQRRDEYWKPGSVCEDYSAIEIPVFLVGGWADAYTNAIFRMLEGLSCPRKALIGPWAHIWPEHGVPGPAIDFQGEAVRWWDRWLKGEDNGVDDEPPVRAWMQDAVAPASYYEQRPGRWVAEDEWPSSRVRARELHLNADGLGAAAGTPEPLVHRSPQIVGLDAGAWCSYGNPGDLPRDQRRDDAQSLAFTSEPLPEPLELLGSPVAELALACDRPEAFVAVRLCDVAPDGASTLITRGILNLCHRDGHDAPAPLRPGRRYDVAVQLKATGYAIPAGHRLRVAISTAYWPWIWPSPEPVELTVFAGASRLRLPDRPPRAADAELPAFGAPYTAPALPFEWIRPRTPVNSVDHDLITGRVTIDSAWAFFGGRRFESGLEYDYVDPVRFTIDEDDPLSAVVEVSRRIAIGQGDWRTRVETTCRMTADADTFRVSGVLDAFEGETRIFTRAYDCAVPREPARSRGGATA